MKQKHLARLAAFLVGATGAAAFGDHHISGGQVDCSGVPFDCFDECLALKSCLEIPESGGTTTCASESSALAACEARSGGGPGGGGGGGGVIIVPACPGGQHYHAGGGCHADHECGDDEIGGGSEECTKCGPGKVPNDDGTACETCEHGESSDTPGACAGDPCGIAEVDAAAKADLEVSGEKNQEKARKPYETGRAYYCVNNKLVKSGWVSSGSDKCFVTMPTSPYQESCWVESPRPADGCDLAGIHTHPYFTKADLGKVCGGKTLRTEMDLIRENNEGMDFQINDFFYAAARGIDAYLGVSDRSCVKGWRVTSDYGNEVVVSGKCTKVP